MLHERRDLPGRAVFSVPFVMPGLKRFGRGSTTNDFLIRRMILRLWRRINPGSSLDHRSVNANGLTPLKRATNVPQNSPTTKRSRAINASSFTNVHIVLKSL
uniref:(northern house mosquito) hypothetical protein n=1 Tax=Culex pipiens TaxID=7175 RepID=A0A8D8DZB2_CULPI